MEHRHALDMVGHREDVEGAKRVQTVARGRERLEVAGEARRVARDVGDAAGPPPRWRHDVPPGAGSRRVEHHEVEPALRRRPRTKRSTRSSDPGPAAGRPGSAAHGDGRAPMGLDRDHAPSGPDPRRRAPPRTARRRRTGPSSARPGCGSARPEHRGRPGRRQRPGAPARSRLRRPASDRPAATLGDRRAPSPGRSRRRARRALDSTAAADSAPPGSAVRDVGRSGWAIRQRSTGTTSCDRCAEQPRPAVGVAETEPGCASPDRPRRRRRPRHSTSRSMPASRCSCSPTTAAEQRRCRGRRDVLEVAAAAAARAGVRAGRLDPIAGTRQSTSTASARRNRASSPPSVTSDPDPLPRDRVPDEDHPPVVPGHAVSAVRDRPDLDLDRRSDQRVVRTRRRSCGRGASSRPCAAVRSDRAGCRRRRTPRARPAARPPPTSAAGTAPT